MKGELARTGRINLSRARKAAQPPHQGPLRRSANCCAAPAFPSVCRRGHAPPRPPTPALIGVLGGARRGARLAVGPRGQWVGQEVVTRGAEMPPPARPLHVRVCDDSGEGEVSGEASPHWPPAAGAGPDSALGELSSP